MGRKRLNRRELAVIEIMVAMHGEFGDDARFTKEAVEHFAGDAIPSTLGLLVMDGKLSCDESPQGKMYGVLPAGREALDGAAKARTQIVVPTDGRMN